MSMLDVSQGRDEVPHTLKFSPFYKKKLEEFHAGRRSPQRDPVDVTSSTNDGRTHPYNSNKSTKDTSQSACVF